MHGGAVKTTKAVAKQLNMMNVGKFKLVLSQNKPKKCGTCKSKQNVATYVKTHHGTVGTITYCQDCGGLVVNGAIPDECIANAMQMMQGV